MCFGAPRTAKNIHTLFTMDQHPEHGRSPRILLVRLSAIGDVIHGMPVLCALRERFPNAHLSWVAEPAGAKLLEGHESLDELVVVPRGWMKSPHEIHRLRRRLRRIRPEATIDMQGLAKSAVAAWLSGCRRRIGFGDEKGRELSTWLNNELVVAPDKHVIDANLRLLAPLGIHSPAVRFNLPEQPLAALAADRTIHELGLQEGYAVVNPGAGWPSKIWPAERFGEVAAYLGEKWRLPSVVVWAGDAERAAAEIIVARSAGRARLAPHTTLAELAAVVRRGQLFIGSDTGPLHLAVAVGVPSIGLFGPMPAERNGPYGPRHIAIQKAAFEGSSRERRNASSELMEAIGVDDVRQACDTILRREAWQAA